MPLPTSKKELLNNLYDAFEKLDGEFDSIPSQMERKQEIEGNISCCDILAYQIGWANLLLGWDHSESNGKAPAMPAEGYKWNQLGKLAQSFYEKNLAKNLKELRAEFGKAFNELIEWVKSFPEEELFGLHQRRWAGEKWAVVKWIQVNTVAPYRSARTKVRRWKRENGI